MFLGRKGWVTSHSSHHPSCSRQNSSETLLLVNIHPNVRFSHNGWREFLAAGFQTFQLPGLQASHRAVGFPPSSTSLIRAHQKATTTQPGSHLRTQHPPHAVKGLHFPKKQRLAGVGRGHWPNPIPWVGGNGQKVEEMPSEYIMQRITLLSSDI